jgi:tetratricopeptide (TPR) repeat protein
MNKEILDIPSLRPLHKGYRIVFEKQIDSSGIAQLIDSEKKLFEELYEDPQKHCDALAALQQRNPHVPEIANLLAFTYLKLKKKKEAEALIEQTYRDNPDYLIGRINYADQCLRCGKIDQIPIIFKGNDDLNALYPERESFYFAEFRGFSVVMGFYYAMIGNREQAEGFYQLAFQVDPLHPSVTALEKKLYPSMLKKWLDSLQKLAGISKKV